MVFVVFYVEKIVVFVDEMVKKDLMLKVLFIECYKVYLVVVVDFKSVNVKFKLFLDIVYYDVRVFNDKMRCVVGLVGINSDNVLIMFKEMFVLMDKFLDFVVGVVDVVDWVGF